MATKRDFSGFPQLQTLAERLREWRSTRPLGERIPAELWQAATEAARTHGAGTTAAALNLDYCDLQRRLLGNSVERKPAPAPPRFVELVAPARVGVPLEVGTVELVQASGARLTLRLPNASPGDLVPVLDLLLRHCS